jgi:hypothetical protein
LDALQVHCDIELKQTCVSALTPDASQFVKNTVLHTSFFVQIFVVKMPAKACSNKNSWGMPTEFLRRPELPGRVVKGD